MRRLLTLPIAFAISFALSAEPVSPSEALSIANDFFNTHVASSHTLRKTISKEASDINMMRPQPYYVFNAENGNGFVIVSGDSRTKKILGYADKGTFAKDNIPPQLSWLLDRYQYSVGRLAPDLPEQTRQTPRMSNVAPLLATAWGQGAPYNDKCPIVYGSKALTGCVATAMAQVINHEKKTNVIKEIPGYDSEVYSPGSLPQHIFDLGNLDNDGIATLMLYCGQSVHMQYGTTESGASADEIPIALKNYFGWEEDVRLLSRSNYNDEHWDRMVEEQIAEGTPIIYSAITESGSAHCFVIDGIQDGLYHVNWGWEGAMDGYYSFQPFDYDTRAEYILMQQMVTLRNDEPSADVITYGTTIDGINYQLDDYSLTAAVLQLKNGEKYRGDLVIPSIISYGGKNYTVNYFGQNAFVGCGYLNSISIPATVTGQAWSIFDGCVNLHKVNIEDLKAFISLETGAWWTGSPFCYGADLYIKGELVKNLVIPEGIEKIGYCKFANCTSIESIEFPSTLKVAGQYSFSGCPNLKRVDMSESSLELIDILAFVNDESIEEVKLPATLKNMREDAFGQVNGPGCKKLKKIVSLATTPPWSEHDHSFTEKHYGDAIVYVPDESVEKYRDAKEWKNFLHIHPLSEEEPVPMYETLTHDGLIYEVYTTKKYAKLIGGVPIDYFKAYTIPSSVEYNGENYPVEDIGFEAVYGLTIESVEAPFKQFGMSSFCAAIFQNEYEIPSTINIIPARAFRAVEMPKLILPSSIKSIGSDAFGDEEADWKYIPEIVCLGSVPPEMAPDAFDSQTKQRGVLKVPYGSKKAYMYAPGWKDFANIVNEGDKQEQPLESDLTLTARLDSERKIKKGMPLAVSCDVRNSGKNAVDGFTLKWYFDGEYIDRKNFEETLEVNAIYRFKENIPVNIEDEGEHVLKLELSLSGDEDTSDNTVSLTFNTFSKGYYRIALIEQFTSEECSLTPLYSPTLTSAIENSGYSDYVTHVAHHCGFFDDFLTVNHDYEWFYNDNGTYTPAMMFNRTDMADDGNTPVQSITDMVDKYIIDNADICNALVSVYLETTSDKAVVKVALEKNDDFDYESGYCYFTIFLIEDNIKAQKQRDPFGDGYLDDYVHHNALRKVLTNVWGDRIYWKDDLYARRYETELGPTWDAKNLKAVAFIHRYDSSSPVNCQVYTANSSDLPQYGRQLEDSDFSGVDLPDVDKTAIPFDIYNLTGVKVKNNATDFTGLPGGLYICNGRKFVVK